MSQYFVLRDRRLRGGVPARPSLYISNTDATTPLARAFQEITVAARKAPIHSLFVLCHGYAGRNSRANVSADAGGMGLQLGKENVLHTNVAAWGEIKGKVQNIVVYACAAANTEPGNQLTNADGRYLMGALAIHAQAQVFAGERIQYYSRYKNLADGAIDFKKWEGTLWRFPPNGGAPSMTVKAPVELGEVYAGTAP